MFRLVPEKIKFQAQVQSYDYFTRYDRLSVVVWYVPEFTSNCQYLIERWGVVATLPMFKCDDIARMSRRTRPSRFLLFVNFYEV